jgi:hypothetical protein
MNASIDTPSYDRTLFASSVAQTTGHCQARAHLTMRETRVAGRAGKSGLPLKCCWMLGVARTSELKPPPPWLPSTPAGWPWGVLPWLWPCREVAVSVSALPCLLVPKNENHRRSSSPSRIVGSLSCVKDLADSARDAAQPSVRNACNWPLCLCLRPLCQCQGVKGKLTRQQRRQLETFPALQSSSRSRRTWWRACGTERERVSPCIPWALSGSSWRPRLFTEPDSLPPLPCLSRASLAAMCSLHAACIPMKLGWSTLMYASSHSQTEVTIAEAAACADAMRERTRDARAWCSSWNLHATGAKQRVNHVFHFMDVQSGNQFQQ